MAENPTGGADGAKGASGDQAGPSQGTGAPGAAAAGSGGAGGAAMSTVGDSAAAEIGRAGDSAAKSAESEINSSVTESVAEPKGAAAAPGGQEGASSGAPGQGPGAGLVPGSTPLAATGGPKAPKKSPLPEGAGLGAAGSSTAPRGNDSDTAPGSGHGSALGKTAAATAAVPMVGAGAQLMVILAFLKWLKGMALMMLALLMNLWNILVALALAAVKAVAGFIMGIGASIASAIGGGVSALFAGVASVMAFVVVGGTVLVGTVFSTNTATEVAQRDGAVSTDELSCTAQANADLEGNPGSAPDLNASTLANAQTVYSVLAAWGMPDENVAGIVGNWDLESRIDPTGVETIFGEPFHLGPKKVAAQAALFDVKVVAPAYGQRFPGVKTVGIGLGQWSNGRNANLVKYAQGNGVDWFKIETQLGFMLSAAEGGNATVVRGMIESSQGTPSQAALYFHDKWERSADTESMKSRRAAAAEKWMGMFAGWEVNEQLADSILAQSGATAVEADTDRAEAVREGCITADAPEVPVSAGGMNLEQATALMAQYRAEGEGFLRSRYGGGGPGDCGYGKADNCVGFSTYFVNKYTSFQQYARGNGIQTAHTMASMTGKTVSTTPTVYSVASGPGSGPAGHTFVVLGIQGDRVIIGEAACGTNHRGTRAREVSLASLSNGTWKFVDMSDLMTNTPAQVSAG